ncbi:MAG: hypothetical protein ABSA46_02565 [Thermodesulfovibrionales bacterium]|jgi:hypothetical protein
MRRIVLVIFVSLIAGSVYAESQKPPPSVTQGQVQPTELNSKSKQKSDIKAQDRNNASQNTIATQKEQTTSTKDSETEKNIKPNSDSQLSPVKDDQIIKYTFWLMIFTGVLAFSTIGLWIATFFAGKATKKAADAAQKSAEVLPLIERAWVFVESVDWLRRDPSEEGTQQIALTVQLWNAGKTPAILTRWNTAAFPMENYPSRKDIGNISDNKIPPGGYVLKSDEKSGIEANGSFSDKKWEEIESEGLKLLCYGRVEYKDILGDDHEIGFCWEWSPHALFRSPFHISDNKELNYYT